MSRRRRALHSPKRKRMGRTRKKTTLVPISTRSSGTGRRNGSKVSFEGRRHGSRRMTQGTRKMEWTKESKRKLRLVDCR
jgi:hypothetical protein